MALAAVVGFTVIVSSCATSAPPSEQQEQGAVEGRPLTGISEDTGFKQDVEEYARVRIFYVTDRMVTGLVDPSMYYGSERGKISYGFSDVSIPRDHRMGVLEAPSIWRLEFREDPEKHVVLLHVARMQEADFFGEIKNQIQMSPRKQAFVFIHGYNVTFAKAARRTAQIKYDLGFDGVALLYSWPSLGTFTGYEVDEANANWSKPNFKHLLADLSKRSGAEEIFLIAHSMGSRILAGAVTQLLAERPSIKPTFREIVLAAPDIDADVFTNEIAPTLASTPPFVTLYASSQDTALLAAKTFYGNPRAGDSGDSLTVVSGIDTVDASNVSTGFVGHAYYAESKSILSDIFYLLRDGSPPSERFGLEPVTPESPRYWKFRE